MPTVPGLTALSVLARGGYATVYRAVQESVGRDVAVKVENRRLESEPDQRRFLREARAAGRMSGHPNVIDLFDAGVTQSGHPYLIMELCEASYAERMKTNPLSAVEARDVGVKIADALADAHALGVLHRDVKPANLLISRFGEPQLADFGLAVLVEARDYSITLDVLTPAYASPEMFRYAPPSPAADVYALCATLYALMRGRPPRWRDEVNPSLVSLVDMFGEPIPDVPGVPAELMNVLRGGMANDERLRPTAVQLRDTLLQLDFDPGGANALPASRRPVFGPPSWGPSESVSPAPGWSRQPAAADDAFPGDNEATRPQGGQDDRLAFQPGGVPAAAPRRLLPTLRPRHWLGLALAAGGLALVTLFGVVGMYAAGHRAAGQPRGVPGPSATTLSPKSSGTAAGVSCGLTAASASMRCAATPECFGALTVQSGIVQAAATACEKPHTWEVFALDTLPTSVTSVDYPKIKDNGYVRSACNDTNLALVDFEAFSWRVDVLPPSPDAFHSGDRTFRCLAGPLTGTSVGSKFAKAGR
jgi:tRNA A-37 threonylcarbamoyl transferase component Bud32